MYVPLGLAVLVVVAWVLEPPTSTNRVANRTATSGSSAAPVARVRGRGVVRVGGVRAHR